MSRWTRLLDVYAEIEEDPRWYHLRTPGIVLVPGDGPQTVEDAKVMVVGEAPGAHENGARRPFVGKSGEVLDDLLLMAGLARSRVFVTNVVKYRPPGNRKPTVLECFNGQESLRKEWSIVRPLLTIAVGATAHTTLRPTMILPVSGCRARLDRYGSGDGHWVTSQYHPAFGLRNPSVQPQMERDWEELGELLREYLPEVFR